MDAFLFTTFRPRSGWVVYNQQIISGKEPKMKKTIATAIAGIMLATATAASAAPAPAPQERGYHQDRRDHRDDRRDDRREHRQERREDRREYREDRREYRQDQRRAERYYDNRYQAQGYYGQRPYYYSYGNYRQGQVYGNYRNSRYYVNDYHRYGLPAPRAGHRYYRDDNGNIVMVAIASGIIGLILGGALNSY